MSKKEKLIKELVDLIGEDKFTEKDKEELKSLSVEDLELMINLERVLAETSPSMEELLDKLTSSDDKEEDNKFEIIPMPSFEELFGGGLKITHPNQTIAAKNKKNVKAEVNKIMSPSEMVKELDKTVIGHPYAKKHLAVVMFKHLMERNNQMKLKEMGKEMTKSNVWITGNSGSGKTLMVTTLCKILKLDYVLVDCASITAEGYIGNNWSEEIGRIYDVCEGDEDRINKSIVILDELDKLKNNNSDGNRVDVGGGEATKALLKILEGTQLKVGKGFGMTKYIDTSNIMFIATGTFNNGEPSIEDIVRERLDKKGHKREIGFFGESAFKKEVIHDVNEIRRNISHEDMIKYGMSVEMIGRFGDIINLDILTKEDYIKIAKLEKGGFEEYKTLFELYGKTLTVKEDVYELLAERMMNSETNARSLKSLCDKVMVELVYEMVDNNRKKKYVVTREMVEESLGFKKEQEELKAEDA